MRPLGDESLESAQPAKQFRTQRCRVGFFTLPSPVNQLPKVLISKSTASPLPDLGCPVAPICVREEALRTQSRSGYKLCLEEVQSEQWVVLTVQSTLGGVGGWQDRPSPSTRNKISPHAGSLIADRILTVLLLPLPPLSLPRLFQTPLFSSAAEQKASVEDGLIDGRAHSLAMNSVVLCDSPDHQHLPRHCCHVGPLAGSEY